MENEEMLEQTNETENVENQTTEEIDEGIELTDTSDTTESDDVEDATSNDETVEEEKKDVKTFTQEEVDAIVQKRLARKDRDYQKELSKYKSAEEVLKAGLGATDINDAEEKLRDYWTEQGMKLPEKVKPGLTEHQLEVLARDEANEIIESGDAEAEANKLASKGWDNMNPQEKAIFNTLAKHLDHEKKINELKSIGVKADLLDSKEFKDFAGKFNPNTSIKDIYELYSKSHKEPKQVKKIGDITNSTPDTTKTHYTDEEISRLTPEQLDDDKVWEAVRRSMTS
jgi:hypothetical protein